MGLKVIFGALHPRKYTLVYTPLTQSDRTKTHVTPTKVARDLAILVLNYNIRTTALGRCPIFAWRNILLSFYRFTITVVKVSFKFLNQNVITF